eukprot:TRINITY_DN11745_c0_g7_i4.p3 TRINITY_DN11745_c0_g7~~TRINITY_DN11745_c0_g7_i4.p3  ORF type:complete len:140 (-),score=4.55 TRINITY_DN11745_c0_g7_i4:1401-1820(-)
MQLPRPCMLLPRVNSKDMYDIHGPGVILQIAKLGLAVAIHKVNQPHATTRIVLCKVLLQPFDLTQDGRRALGWSKPSMSHKFDHLQRPILDAKCKIKRLCVFFDWDLTRQLNSLHSFGDGRECSLISDLSWHQRMTGRL